MRSVRRKRPEQVVRLTAGERRFLAGLVRRGGRQGVALRAAALLLSLKKQASKSGALFELWYADGVRFDLLPSVRSAWRRRGERLALPTPGKNVRVGVVGAVRYPTGDCRFAHQPRSVTTALFLPVLETLVAARAVCQAAGEAVQPSLGNGAEQSHPPLHQAGR